MGQSQELRANAVKLFDLEYDSLAQRTDRMFAFLLVVQWFAALLLALAVSPATWSGAESSMHPHVFAALILGGILTIPSVTLVLTRPGWPPNKYILASVQLLWSGLLIHIGAGRIEFHFHIFGSLAMIAFYRDYRVLIPATLITAADHILRGLYWPESIYGVTNPAWWRALEHIGWVLFIDVFLFRKCVHAKRDLFRLCRRQASVEASKEALHALADDLELRVQTRTSELSKAVVALEASQEELERRRATEKQALEARRRELHMFIDELPVGVYIVDAEGRPYFINNCACSIIGRGEPTGESGVGPSPTKAFMTFFPRGSTVPIPMEDTPGATALRGEVFESDVLDIERPDGERRQLQVRGVPIYGARDRLSFALTVFEDITDRVARDALSLQGQKLESVGQLAAGIAHEINTPMQYIGDNVRFLQSGLENLIAMMSLLEDHADTSPEIADKIRQRSKSLRIDLLKRRIPRALASSIEGVETVSRLVSALKDFSHPGTGEKRSVDLNQAIRSTVEVSRNEWRYCAEMELQLGEGLEFVPCLEGEVKQVVLNMIVNASHAIDTPDRGDDLGVITISTRVVDHWAEIAIRDTGCGIPDHVRPKLFDPFFTTKDVGKGTGQGLPIARSLIVDKHGGTIGVDSELGQGTTFTIRLPMRDASETRKAS